MSKGLQIALVDLREWLQEETAPLVKPLKDKGESLLEKVKKRLGDIQDNGDRIFDKSDKEVQKGSAKTYRCAKAANKMSKNVSGIINHIAVPDDISYDNLQVLQEDLGKAFAAIEHQRRLWYRRISPYFILDRRRLDIAIKRAEDSNQDLQSFLSQEYVKLNTTEDTMATVDKLFRLLEEAENVREQKTQTEARAELIAKKIRENEQRVDTVQDKAELSQLAELEQRIRDLRAKVKYNLRHLQKSFYKMQSLAQRGQVALTPDEARQLELCRRNPFEALASEGEGYPLLKRIVQKLDDAIRQDKLKLKTTRLRKAREQIDGILKQDSLADLHRDCLEAISKRKSLARSETVAATKDKLSQIQTTLQNLRKRKESVESRSKALEERHQRTLTKIDTQKNDLERSIFELTDKRVDVVLAETNRTDTNI